MAPSIFQPGVPKCFSLFDACQKNKVKKNNIWEKTKYECALSHAVNIFLSGGPFTMNL